MYSSHLKKHHLFISRKEKKNLISHQKTYKKEREKEKEKKMLSLLPWGDLGLAFKSAVSQTWTVLDDWRVSELEFEAARKRVFDNRLCPYVSVNNGLMDDFTTKTQRFGEAADTVKQMDCLTIYNDKQLWLAFKFFVKYEHDARIEISPELKRGDASYLCSISEQFFGKELPYIPNQPRFNDTYRSLNVSDINWYVRCFSKG